MDKIIILALHAEMALAERIAFLSQALAAQSLATSEALEGTLEDGLAKKGMCCSLVFLDVQIFVQIFDNHGPFAFLTQLAKQFSFGRRN
jgi:hypothetical protein